jgi:hypothetical protein
MDVWCPGKPGEPCIRPFEPPVQVPGDELSTRGWEYLWAQCHPAGVRVTLPPLDRRFSPPLPQISLTGKGFDCHGLVSSDVAFAGIREATEANRDMHA